MHLAFTILATLTNYQLNPFKENIKIKLILNRVTLKHCKYQENFVEIPLWNVSQEWMIS